VLEELTALARSVNADVCVAQILIVHQVPVIPGGHRLIDPETPLDVYTKPSWFGREEMELVFSDEFNTDGRTFYAGDDPFWEAVDLHYHV
jgi:hypothetical protein